MKKLIYFCLFSFFLAIISSVAADFDMKPVDSSLLSAVGYDTQTKTLAVQFVNNSDTYYYNEVPEELLQQLLKSDSKGAFYVKNIKGKFKFDRK